jgi:hypothetical protein
MKVPLLSFIFAVVGTAAFYLIEDFIRWLSKRREQASARSVDQLKP